MEKDTFLIMAVKRNDIESVKRLISEGIDVNEKNGYGTTALYWAYKNMNIEMIQVLTQAGAIITF